ncbi:MAG: preprotein translocase subunit SecY [Tepidisphaeraceae bacterium]|jgi:preprotein translocase subunit SecY
MIQTFLNIFRVPELRNKVLFTLLLLGIYRIGFHVPLPGMDQEQFAKLDAQRQKNGEDSAASRLANYVSLFSGGSLTQSTIFGLGIMPYISSSIIFQLLGTVIPSLEKLQKEGETGRKKIQEWTRYATVPLCLIQSVFLLATQNSASHPLVQRRFLIDFNLSFWLTGLCCLTAGTIFLMWLGEQIDEYGLGNGVSLIILSGIVARMPGAIGELIQQTNLRAGQPDPSRPITPGKVLFLAASFVFVVAGSILITQAQRRIPIQQAKHTRGRHIYGGQRQYLPLRVNHGGVMPIIFAQSLMLFPGIIFGKLHEWGLGGGFIAWLNDEFGRGRFVYIITESAMIYFFAYFWTTVQFQPKEMANQLRDYGSFIPGLRPGKRTADYLEKVMMRITYVGAAFLCVIAVVPMAVTENLGIPFQISAFLGGTGLLIVVSVALDMVQRIEANLLMRNYSGFLGGAGGQKGKRIKGRQY